MALLEIVLDYLNLVLGSLGHNTFRGVDDLSLGR